MPSRKRSRKQLEIEDEHQKAKSSQHQPQTDSDSDSSSVTNPSDEPSIELGEIDDAISEGSISSAEFEEPDLGDVSEGEDFEELSNEESIESKGKVLENVESDTSDKSEAESEGEKRSNVSLETEDDGENEHEEDNDDVYVSDYDSEVEAYSFADKRRLWRKTAADRGDGTLLTRNVPQDTPEGAAASAAETDTRSQGVSEGNLFKEALYPRDSDDSSEDENMVNTVGRVPLWWYNEQDHIGYDRDGQRILRKDRGDKLDELLRRHDDPNWLRTVYDAKNDREYTFSNEELDILLRVAKGHFPNPATDPFEDAVEWFDYHGGALDDRDLPRRRFQPSRWERKKMMRLAQHFRKHGIPDHLKPYDQREHQPRKAQTYLLWDEAGQVIGDRTKSAARPPAPKAKLPGIEESYRPPAEYNPRRQYPSLRRVPGYGRYLEERFERCMYLYMAPRKHRKVLKKPLSTQDLLPELPDIDSLRPFPTTMTLVYRGHTDHVRSVSVDPTGQYLASGSDDGTVRLWEVESGKCMQVWRIGRRTEKDPQPVTCVAWNPSTEYHLLAACAGDAIHLIAPPLTAPSVQVREATLSVLKQRGRRGQQSRSEWVRCTDEQRETGRELEVRHPRVVVNASWHRRGDYFACLGLHGSVSIHQLSRKQSQQPFRKGTTGPHMPRVAFHPTKPLFYVVTMYMVRVYDLAKQTILKKFRGRCRWISDLAVHPSGNFFLTSGFDNLIEFFDMELTLRPFRTFKYHKNAVRSVAFHPKYPLFASASDDLSIHMFHCRVYDDWLRDPSIVPVKVLRGHLRSLGIGVLDLAFHPEQPWLFSAGADNTLRLWT